MFLDTHLIILGSNGLSNTTESSTKTTARKRRIKTPMNIPPISPVLSPLLFSLLDGGLTVVIASGFLLVSAEPMVVVTGGCDTSRQSGDLRVSSEVGQEASMCSREDV